MKEFAQIILIFIQKYVLSNRLAVCDDYCKTGGQCKVRNTGDPTCSCSIGYFGDQCQNCKH